jgi:hypothetical protein
MPEQLVVPLVQLTLHVPPEQRLPGMHALPHAPQFALSLERSRHTPEHVVVPPPQLS